jgi:phosphoglycerol geranylgeranyltransferase
MEPGKILKRLYKARERGETVHMTLLDPDKLSHEKAEQIAVYATEAGSDAIMLGGSTQATHQHLDLVAKALDDTTGLPIILFPGSAAGVTPYADAIFFLQAMNSPLRRFLIEEQVKAVPYVDRLVEHNGLEVIGMRYLIVEPGMMAGKVTQANLIKRNDPKTASQWALCAQYFASPTVYLEAGSGAPQPVPTKLINAVIAHYDKRWTGSPPPVTFIGGGIRTPYQARAAARAGADVIVTGTLAEEAEDVKSALESIVSAVKN